MPCTKKPPSCRAWISPFLASPASAPAERVLALKFLIHFVGDLHQPLHASDHDDRGGNCIGLEPSPDGYARNLHAYWDTSAVEALGASAQDIAAKLDGRITLTMARNGARRCEGLGDEIVSARSKRRLQAPFKADLRSAGWVALSAGYQAMAQHDAENQLEKAGIRMAFVLNKALR